MTRGVDEPAVHIRPVEPNDLAEWRRMRLALWPDSTEADLGAWRERTDAVTLVAEPAGVEGALCGFAEIGLRAYADGCETSPVAFLEGWFVDPAHRRHGVGTALMQAAEVWARERGLSEFASDSLLDDADAHRAHEALGFKEVERAIRYRKLL